MKLKVKLLLPWPSGAPTTEVTAESEVTIKGTSINEHDLAGVLFASEFAINNNASSYAGRSIRAHLFLE